MDPAPFFVRFCAFLTEKQKNISVRVYRIKRKCYHIVVRKAEE